jgi:hypothetical protein
MAEIILTEIFKPWIIVFLIPLALVIFAFGNKKRAFKKSSYSQASGNGFESTVYNKGNHGEYLTFSLLEKLEGEKRLMTNLYLTRGNGKSTEVDLVMIHPTGIYVFESKNYSGWIFGDDKSRYWTQNLKSGKKNRFLNPVWQNAAHIEALSLTLGPGYEKYFISFIVFSQRCQLKKITLSSPDIVVVKRDYLLGYVKDQINKRSPCFTSPEMDELKKVLSKFALADAETKERHIQSISKGRTT